MADTVPSPEQINTERLAEYIGQRVELFTKGGSQILGTLAHIANGHLYYDVQGQRCFAPMATFKTVRPALDEDAQDRDTEPNKARADAKHWHDAYQQAANATDEFLGELLALLPGAEDQGSDVYDQIPRGIKALRSEVDRLAAQVDELTARLEAADEAFTNMHQVHGGVHRADTLKHLAQIMATLRGDDTPSRVAYERLHNRIDQLTEQAEGKALVTPQDLAAVLAYVTGVDQIAVIEQATLDRLFAALKASMDSQMGGTP